ncbi:MAG: Adenylosuccinate synthetase [uncultured Chloroflexi bacterium]|uniref:Adenylosuccinate synthetase n=1 Tax=uncultured Chloroflexota bacterium TaxID=166587 RepID=A0A6J4JMP6_9CHLR|nr:MAG: Adenylosuccinate synthetase [uncultured Chloroflexota bacterium]
MAVTAVVGCGWGDEGKGKIVDALAAERHARLVIRFNGGPNAGHTVVPEVDGSDKPAWSGVVFRLHQVPSGVFTPGCVCLVGTGTVVDPDGFLRELAELEQHGVSTENVLLSDRAHLVLPMHRDRERLLEQAREQLKQGTTLQGIGPTYEDKMARIGLRLGDLLDGEYLDEYLPFLAEEHSRRLGALGGEPVSAGELRELCDRWAQQIGHRIVDSHPLVQRTLREGGDLILEGQLGACREIDWGIYPYVTSSGATAAAGAAGSGVPVTAINEVIGVLKAFSTTVGEGPFVTELFGAEADRLRYAGESESEHEFGATTGRSRRCGWFDAVAARQAAALNGCTDIALTKLDVLDGLLPELQVASGYEMNGERVEYVPSSTRRLKYVTPVYETLPCWKQPSRGARTWERLPAEAQAYAKRIEQLVEVPVTYLGTGPARLAMAKQTT